MNRFHAWFGSALACGLTTLAYAQPGTFTDLGTHNTIDETVTQAVTLTAANNVQWFKIVLPAVSQATLSYVDIWLNTPGDITDSVSGVYDNTGARIALSDDEGPGLLSQFSFGQSSPTRPPIGTGSTFAGGNGALSAGTYWIAIIRYNTGYTMGTTGWSVTSTYTGTQRTTTMSIHVHPAGVPTNPSGVGTATPTSGSIGSTFVAKVTVTPGTNPTSTGLAVSLDAALVNAGTIALHDDGVAPDTTAGDNIFSGNVTVGVGTTNGAKSLPFTITDAQSRTGTGSISYTVVPPPPANDNCANATAVSEGTYAWDNSSATTDGTSPTCQTSSNKDIWFSYTPTFTGTQTITLCGTNFDTVLSVYSGCGGTQLGCDDDTCDGVNPPGSGNASIITGLSVTSGTPVLIRVAAFGSSPTGGAGTMTINAPPTNPGGVGTATPNHGGIGTTFVAAVTVTPGNSPPSTGLGVVLNATNVDGGAAITLHDDGVAPDVTAGDNIFSGNVTVGPAATLGAKSLGFTVSDAQGRSGTGSITFTVSVANDDCAQAIAVTNGTYAWDNSAATTDGASPSCQATSNKDIWYVYTPTLTGTCNISLCGTSFDTVLSVYSSCGGSQLACDDDTCDGVTPPGSGFASIISGLAVSNSSTYLIRVASYGASPTGGVGTLLIEQPTTNPSGTGHCVPSSGGVGQSAICRMTVTPGSNPPSTGLSVHLDATAINDGASITMRDNGIFPDQTAGDNEFACTVTVGPGTTTGIKTLTATITDAQSRTGTGTATFTVSVPNDDCANAIAVAEGSYVFDTSAATTDGSASCTFDSSGKDIWYTYTPTVTGSATISLCGSSFDTLLTVFSGCGGSELACDDDTCGSQSEITGLSVTAGVPVTIRVAGFQFTGEDPASGAGTLTISEPNTPPSGTGTATPTSGHNGDTFVAKVTVTPGYNPTSTGLGVSLDATNVDGGTVVLHDDGVAPDVTAGDNIFSGNVTVGVAATPGLKSLTFTVSDAESRSSTGAISYTVLNPPPANDLCANATVVAEGSYAFDNSSASTDGASPSCQATSNKDVWFDYIASHNGTVEIATCATNFDTVLSVTDACGGTQLACDDDSCNGPGSGLASDITGLAVTRNTHYVIRVASYGSSPSGGAGTLDITLTASPCPGDINGDFIIDLSDLAAVLGAYGTSTGDPGYNAAADLNSDGIIDLSDLAAILGLYGSSC